MPLILRADSLIIIKCWVDSSDAAHLYMRGHMGATMSFGRVSVTGITNNHKINANISTKAEFIGADNTLLQII